MLEDAHEDPSRVKLPQIRSNMTVDRIRPLPTSLQSDFLPDDVLFALTQPPIPRDKLGPVTRSRPLDTSVALARAPAAKLWGHKKQREKFKHLLTSTACSCGAGRDISFLYDAPQEYSHPQKEDKFDKSAIRKDAEQPSKKVPLQLPDSLVPDEYHIVKSRGVIGIEFHEDKYTTNPEDHEKHLVVFPSMKPVSRFEVQQLKKTMENMLDKVGCNEEEVAMKGPTQIHNLLEIIKKEQNIYNVIFHELIRQVTVDCVDRGELLAELRTKYRDLINKIPPQIISLHEEVMAQRALDRRLTDELLRFKNTIGILTNELSDVKEHDRFVTRDALKTQEELKTALAEAQKNSSLLAEYHDLYELQRKRLEGQVFSLIEERDLWSTAAYSLALKVTEECRIVSAKRLHLCEKAWTKLATHYSVLLSDKDTDLLTHVQKHVEVWRDLIENFNFNLQAREEEMKDALMALKGSVEKWIVYFEDNCFNSDGQLIKPPAGDNLNSLLIDLKAWTSMLNKEAELFGGNMLLGTQEEIANLQKEMEGWTDDAMVIFSRHRGRNKDKHPDHKRLLELNEEIEKLLKEYQLRISGENGIAAIVIHLQNMADIWETRVKAAVLGTMSIPESDWRQFYLGLEEWVVALEEAQSYVGSAQSEADRKDEKPHISINIYDLVHKTQKWATTMCNSIDSEDARLVEKVLTLHSEMILWVVQTLLRLASNREGNSEEAAEMVLLGTVSIPQLIENAISLFDSVSHFSNHLTLKVLSFMGHRILDEWWEKNNPKIILQLVMSRKFKKGTKISTSSRQCEKLSCCEQIVADNVQKRQENNEDNPDQELKDLKQLRSECEEWIITAQNMMSQLTGESVESMFPARSSLLLAEPDLKSDLPESLEGTLRKLEMKSSGAKLTDMSEENLPLSEASSHSHIMKESRQDVHISKTGSIQTFQTSALGTIKTRSPTEIIQMPITPTESSTQRTRTSKESIHMPITPSESSTQRTRTPKVNIQMSITSTMSSTQMSTSNTQEMEIYADKTEQVPSAESVDESSTDLENTEETMEDEQMMEEKDDKEAHKETKKIEKSDQIQVLGRDENTHVESLEGLATLTKKIEKSDRIQVLGIDENTRVESLEGSSTLISVTSSSIGSRVPDTKRAFEALATLETLQTQLLMTEKRAQEAEERADSFLLTLVSTQETLRATQKQLQELQEKVFQAPTPPPPSASVSPVSSRTSTVDMLDRKLLSEKDLKDAKKKETKQKMSAKGKKK